MKRQNWRYVFWLCLSILWQYVYADPIVLTNLPAEQIQPSVSDRQKKQSSEKSAKKKQAENKASDKKKHTEQAIVSASQRMDEWFATRQSDPFFLTHAAILKKMGAQLRQSGIPPDYWPEVVAFAYAGLSVQTQQLMKILQQIETLERKRYEQELVLHLQKPRLIPKPVLNLEPLYVLRQQLIELSAQQ